ncbi:F0F1 ATP synthase subunit gamma [Candidatus Omnitrophota bacterium]
MGKTAAIKSDLDDVTQLVEIIQILKDVASNHFYNTAKRKQKLAEFAVSFIDFFRMVSLAETKSPLVSSETEKVAILPITSEGGFMAEMTSKVARAAVLEADKHDTQEFVVIGKKGEEKLKLLTDKKITLFTDVEAKGLFETTLEVKDYIIDLVKQGKIGRLYAVYPRAKTINFIKPAVVKLLPSEELITKQQGIKDTIEKVLVESELGDVMDYLAELWLTCRLYEMLEDCVIAGFAAQSQQLEASLERMKKDKKGLMVSFKKAKKGDIDQSLREVFTSKLMTSKGGRR